MTSLPCLIPLLFFSLYMLYKTLKCKCKHFYREIKSDIRYDIEGYYSGEYVTYKCDVCNHEITRFEFYGNK